jgi:hypothetical protein
MSHAIGQGLKLSDSPQATGEKYAARWLLAHQKLPYDFTETEFKAALDGLLGNFLRVGNHTNKGKKSRRYYLNQPAASAGGCAAVTGSGGSDGFPTGRIINRREKENPN